MPTFTAIALDRLLEPGASNSRSPMAVASKKGVSDSPSRLERRNTTPFSVTSDDLKSGTKRLDIPPPHPQLRRRNTVTFTAAEENKVPTRPQISPALYATPESTPLPDSPISSFPPSSPYLINHKRRGPRLLKSFSNQNVAAVQKRDNDEAESKFVNGHLRSFSEEIVAFEQKEFFDEKSINEPFLRHVEVEINGSNGGISGSNGDVVAENGEVEVNVGSCSERDGGDTEDFFDPQESMSFTSSTDGGDNSVELSAKVNTPMGEFFDAWEELSSESGRQPQRALGDIETELREMRLSLLMEIERRKQAEECLNSMRSQWQMLREKLRDVGFILPAELTALSEDSQSEIDPIEDICRQIRIARFVSESIGRGVGKAEVEEEMENQLEMKNFEIARLCDRLHYYEAMNREMSQRNQEAIEIARHERQKRRRRQKWVWGSIVAAITLGSTALAWSYLPSGKGSSSTNHLEASEPDNDVQC